MAAQEFERIVRAAMDREDLTLYALARSSGIERNSWYAWFRGEYRPQRRTIARATSLLKVSADELLAPFGAPTRTAHPVRNDIDALVDAIDRLTAAISGRFDDLDDAIAEGIARDRARGGAAQKRPAPMPR